MPDPFRKVSPGDRLNVPATFYNKLVDLAKQGDQRAVNALAHAAAASLRDLTRIKIRNDSGSPVGRYGVLGLGDPIITPSQNENAFAGIPYHSGKLPADPDHVGQFAIILEPLADGKTGDAAVAGVCQVKLNVAADENFADIEAGKTTLKVSKTGSAAILWKEADSGEDKWGIVRFGSTKDCSADSCPQSLACVTDITELSGYDDSKKQALIHNASGCLAWQTIGDCTQ